MSEDAEKAAARKQLEELYGDVWSTDEMERDFTAVGFGAPFVEVVRKSDNARGSLQFSHRPRFYFRFVEAKG